MSIDTIANIGKSRENLDHRWSNWGLKLLENERFFQVPICLGDDIPKLVPTRFHRY